MGLDCSHDAWHGAYSAFMRWREKIAEVAGLPPLHLMEGFYFPLSTEVFPPTLYHGIDTKKPMDKDGGLWMSELDKRLPIKWNCLKSSPLHILLRHSDCDGKIGPKNCGKIAKALEKLIPLMPDEVGGGHIRNWKEVTQQFIDGLKLAHERGEDLEFH